MKKILIILASLVIIITTVYRFNVSNLASVSDTEASNKSIKAIEHSDLPIEHLVSQQPKNEHKIASKGSKNLNNRVIPIDPHDSAPIESPFMQSETAEKVLKASGKLRENLRGEVYLAIDNQHISSLEQGDTLRLDIPFFDMYQDIEIENTQFDTRGNKTLNASFKINDDIYTTTITVNDRAIYGHIETPDGIYSLAGNGEYAWMAEAKDLTHGAVQDQIGGNSYDGSADEVVNIEPTPITIKGK